MAVFFRPWDEDCKASFSSRSSSGLASSSFRPAHQAAMAVITMYPEIRICIIDYPEP